MKRIIILLSLLLLIYIFLRLIFSYTIINIPDNFGRITFVGGSKYDFPICIVNPIRTKIIKEKIINSVEQSLAEQLPYTDEEIKSIKYAVNYRQPYDNDKYYKICNYEDIRKFFQDTLKRIQNFNIISVATSTEEVGTNENVDSFLLQQEENLERKCVAVFDKKTNQLLRLRF